GRVVRGDLLDGGAVGARAPLTVDARLFADEALEVLLGLAEGDMASLRLALLALRDRGRAADAGRAARASRSEVRARRGARLLVVAGDARRQRYETNRHQRDCSRGPAHRRVPAFHAFKPSRLPALAPN